jgi:hypothetical protein
MSEATILAQGPVDVNVRRQWLCNLLADNKRLPIGTRILTTVGGVRTGGTHELPGHVLEPANRLPNHLSDYVPFWVLGWRDLHGDLLPPNA